MPASRTLAALLLAAASAAAQPPPGEPAGDSQQAFFEAVRVDVVNVEVFVTDSDGQPVTGLTREEFELLEDGKPVPITNFYAVEGRRPVLPAAPEEATAPTAERALPAHLAELPEPQVLHLVVYIDNFNIRPLNRNRVFHQLRRFLIEKLSRDDRVMLVSYDRSLNIRRAFTDDPLEIAAALAELEGLTGHALAAEQEQRRIRRAIEDADNVSAISSRVRQYASSVANDLRFTLNALRDMIDSLAGLPARKALLYVSDGLPLTPANELYVAVQRKFGDMAVLSHAREFDAARSFQQLAAEANASGVTLYTVDATGLQFYASGQAQSGRTSTTDGLSFEIDAMATDNLQSSIRLLAEQTGGAAIFNTNDISIGLEKVASDFTTYYSLGFMPVHTTEGRYHRLEVRVPGRDVDVRHRQGYRDKPPAARMVDATRSIIRWGYEDNPLEVSLELGAATRHEGGNYAVPIIVRIPLDKVVLVPRSGVHQARLQVFFAAMDEGGDMADVQQAMLPIEIPNDEVELARDGHYTFEARLLMRAGRQRVGVGVRDELGAVASFVTGGIELGG